MFVDNICRFDGATQSMSFDDRGGKGSGCCAKGRLPFAFLSRVPYATSAAWSKYPGLAGILDDEPCLPKHNVVSHNVLCGGATAFAVEPAQVAAWGSEMQNNTAVAQCPAWTGCPCSGASKPACCGS